MNQWSIQRKRIIFSIVVLTLVILIGVPVFFLFYRVPSCFDGKQNGDETGIDCGGSCRLLCTAESLPLIQRGDPRVLEVLPGVFEIVALVENPNPDAEIYRAGYALKIYDDSSIIPLRIFEGDVYVPKGVTFAIFEGPFDLADGVVPTRATLEWEEGSLVWQRNILPTPKIIVRDINLLRASTTPRMDAIVENVSLENVSNIDLVVLISNESGNIFAASKTFVDSLPAGTRVPVVFAWPRPFTDTVIDINIIIRILPNKSFLK